jgi:integrase
LEKRQPRLQLIRLLAVRQIHDPHPWDNNILSRHIKPAARKLGMEWVNWQVLRRSCATWLQQAGVDVKDAQGIMRHSRASTTQDVYQQLVPESQRRAIQKLTAYAGTARLVQ